MNSSIGNKTPDSKVCSFFNKFKKSVRQCSTPCNEQNKYNSLCESEMSTIVEEGDGSTVSQNTVIMKRKRSSENLNDEPPKTVIKKEHINDTLLEYEDDELVCTVVDELSIIFDKKLKNLEPANILPESQILPVNLILDKSITEEKKADLEKSILNFAQPPPLKEFFSEDPRENEDNQNPKWSDWKSLTSDEQRYKAVKEVWKNPQIPDPRKNLTTYNWRARNNLPKKNYSFPFLRSNYSHLKAGHLNDIFKKYMSSTKELQEQKLYFLENWLSEKLNSVTCKSRQLKASSNYKCYNRINEEAIHEIRNLKRFYQQKVSFLHKQFSERVQRLKSTQKELQNVYNFYKGLSGNNNSLAFSPAELRQWYELDDILSKYEDIYQ